MREIFGQINYWAVIVSAIIYWLIGMLWFSFLIGKNWHEEMKKHGIKLSKYSGGKMAEKSVWTLILNFIVALGVAFLINATGVTTVGGAIGLGVLIAICFAAAVMATSYLWENRSLELSFYDIFYPFIGIIVTSIICGLWR